NALIADTGTDDIFRTLGPKADGAWHLHEATADLRLNRFVLISSVGGLVLAGGQAGYATANVFLDALARYRHPAGLPATSIAYGLWRGTGLGALRADGDLRRLDRLGLPALTAEEAVALLPDALAAGDPVVVAARVDGRALAARTDEVPALLR